MWNVTCHQKKWGNFCALIVRFAGITWMIMSPNMAYAADVCPRNRNTRVVSREIALETFAPDPFASFAGKKCVTVEDRVTTVFNLQNGGFQREQERERVRAMIHEGVYTNPDEGEIFTGIQKYTIPVRLRGRAEIERDGKVHSGKVGREVITKDGQIQGVRFEGTLKAESVYDRVDGLIYSNETREGTERLAPEVTFVGRSSMYRYKDQMRDFLLAIGKSGRVQSKLFEGTIDTWTRYSQTGEVIASGDSRTGIEPWMPEGTFEGSSGVTSERYNDGTKRVMMGKQGIVRSKAFQGEYFYGKWYGPTTWSSEWEETWRGVEQLTPEGTFEGMSDNFGLEDGYYYHLKMGQIRSNDFYGMLESNEGNGYSVLTLDGTWPVVGGNVLTGTLVVQRNGNHVTVTDTRVEHPQESQP